MCKGTEVHRGMQILRIKEPRRSPGTWYEKSDKWSAPWLAIVWEEWGKKKNDIYRDRNGRCKGIGDSSGDLEKVKRYSAEWCGIPVARNSKVMLSWCSEASSVPLPLLSLDKEGFLRDDSGWYCLRANPRFTQDREEQEEGCSRLLCRCRSLREFPASVHLLVKTVLALAQLGQMVGILRFSRVTGEFRQLLGVTEVPAQETRFVLSDKPLHTWMTWSRSQVSQGEAELESRSDSVET